MDGYLSERCYTPVVPYPGSTVFKILEEHSKKIKSEVLRPFIARIEWQGDVYYQEISTSHPVYYRLEFYWKWQDADVPNEPKDDLAMVKQIRKWDLAEKRDSGLVNLNYPYNHNSRTMLLMYRIMAEIEELNLDRYLRKFLKTDD